MKKIVVPTDFSEYSQFAIDSAISLAKKSNGTVFLLHVLERNETKEMAESALNEFINTASFGEVKYHYEIISGDPVDAIVTSGADLIVMGSKGAKGLKSFFIGTNAEKVAKRSDCSVIIVKEATDLGEMKSIVYPTDMRKEQALIIEDIKALQQFYGANLHLVKVYDDAVLKRASIEDRLKQFAEKYHLVDYSVTAKSGLNEAEEILAFAKEVGSNLIAIGTHERFGLEKLIGGFITGGVINKSDVAIWAKKMPASN